MSEHKFTLIELTMPSFLLVVAAWFWFFDLREISQTYRYLNIAPPYLWGAMFFIVGVFKFYAIVYDRLLIRQTAALVGMVLWFAIGALFLFGDYRSPVGILCLYLAVQSFQSWYIIAPHG